LKRFSPELSNKPQILVATKVDDPQAQKNILDLQGPMTELSPLFFTISSLSGKGIQPLLWEIKERLFSEEKNI
jgi:GTP-binding protein